MTLTTPGEASRPKPQRFYRLILFVANAETNSSQARENLARLCEERLQGRYELRVVDVLEDYQTALEYNVLVTPCLVMVEPRPRVAIAGVLRDRDKVYAALRLAPE
jgi:circadian clock protein KaiB